jgi:hypothetical protein
LEFDSEDEDGTCGAHWESNNEQHQPASGDQNRYKKKRKRLENSPASGSSHKRYGKVLKSSLHPQLQNQNSSGSLSTNYSIQNNDDDDNARTFSSPNLNYFSNWLPQTQQQQDPEDGGYDGASERGRYEIDTVNTDEYNTDTDQLRLSEELYEERKTMGVEMRRETGDSVSPLVPSQSNQIPFPPSSSPQLTFQSSKQPAKRKSKKIIL